MGTPKRLKLSRRLAVFGAAAVLGLMITAGPAAYGEEPEDPLAPKTRTEDALTLQLHMATLVAHDLDEVRRFYADGLGLELSGPHAVDDETRKLQRRLWGVPDEIGWQLYLLRRPAVAGTVSVRVLLLDRETPRVHTTWDAREPGPFSLGFPAADLEPWDAALREMGFESMNPMSKYEVPRPDGSRYGMHETIWKAPDFMHVVTLSRRDGMPQLGPIDPATGRGGPVYSAQSIRDSDRVLAFYSDVLGLELRSDREWKSHGSKGALAVPDGTVFRFSILYAPGASYGHLLFIDFRDGALPDSGVAPRPPNRGLVGWTFPVRDLSEVERRAREAEAAIVSGPIEYESPSLGRHRALTVLAPNGFLVELVELPGDA